MGPDPQVLATGPLSAIRTLTPPSQPHPTQTTPVPCETGKSDSPDTEQMSAAKLRTPPNTPLPCLPHTNRYKDP